MTSRLRTVRLEGYLNACSRECSRAVHQSPPAAPTCIASDAPPLQGAAHFLRSLAALAEAADLEEQQQKYSRLWNNLPLRIRELETLSLFRSSLIKYHYQKFENNLDI